MMESDYFARKEAEQFCMRRDGRKCSPWQPLYSVHLAASSWEERKLYGVDHGTMLLSHDFGRAVNKHLGKLFADAARRP